MTDRTDERSQDHPGTAREPISPKPLVDLVARLRGLLEKASYRPWLYRPRPDLDDWGTIREETKDGYIVALSRSTYDYNADDCRRDKVDPFEDNGRLIVEAVNSLPTLLDALAASQSELSSFKARVAEVLEPFAKVAEQYEGWDEDIITAFGWKISRFRRAAELHAAVSAEDRGEQASTSPPREDGR